MNNQQIINNIFESAVTPMTEDLKNLCIESLPLLTNKETVRDIFPAESHKIVTIDNKDYPVSITIKVLNR